MLFWQQTIFSIIFHSFQNNAYLGEESRKYMWTEKLGFLLPSAPGFLWYCCRLPHLLFCISGTQLCSDCDNDPGNQEHDHAEKIKNKIQWLSLNSRIILISTPSLLNAPPTFLVYKMAKCHQNWPKAIKISYFLPKCLSDVCNIATPRANFE